MLTLLNRSNSLFALHPSARFIILCISKYTEERNGGRGREKERKRNRLDRSITAKKIFIWKKSVDFVVAFARNWCQSVYQIFVPSIIFNRTRRIIIIIYYEKTVRIYLLSEKREGKLGDRYTFSKKKKNDSSNNKSRRSMINNMKQERTHEKERKGKKEIYEKTGRKRNIYIHLYIKKRKTFRLVSKHDRFT